MRLLFVIDNLGSGGAQRQMTNLSIELTRRGHRVDLFVYSTADHFAPQLRESGVRILLHPKPSKFSWAPIRELRKLFRSGDYDLALSFMTTPNLYCLLATAGLRTKPRLVISERFCPWSGWKGVRQRFIERLYPRADHITVNSHHMREHYQRAYGWSDDRVSTIWNGLDLERFTAAPLTRAAGEPLRLLAIGRVEPYKNWTCVLESLAILRDRHGVRATVDLVGRTERLGKTEVEYLAQLQAMIREKSLEDKWRFLGERSDIVDLLASHHALIHPSFGEGLPNVVCESLACGRPVIASDALDHPRLVQDGQTGWLFDHRSPESLAEAIRKLDQLPGDQLSAMGQRARAFAAANLSVARLADDYEALFNRICGAKAK